MVDQDSRTEKEVDEKAEKGQKSNDEQFKPAVVQMFFSCKGCCNPECPSKNRVCPYKTPTDCRFHRHEMKEGSA